MLELELAVSGDRIGVTGCSEKIAPSMLYLEMRRALVLKIIGLLIVESEVSARILARELENMINSY